MKKKNTSVVIFNLANEPCSHYGYLETNSKKYSLNKIINTINNYLYEMSEQTSNFYIFDFAKVVLMYGYNNIYDKRLDYLYSCPFSLQGTEYITYDLSEFINRLNKPRKKVICVDLDNTLWGGIIGESSKSDIQLSDEGLGKVYKDFQKNLKNLKGRGFILTICSKNNLNDAKNFITTNKNMVLKWEDFIIKKINWNNKDQNILEIAKELNLGLDSFIFIDDNIHERKLIEQSLPEVEVMKFPEEISQLNQVLNKVSGLNTFNITTEDLNKTDQYISENNRKIFMKNKSYAIFLKNLKIKCEVNKLNDENLNRFCQLINKVNQFNLTSKRYSESEIKKLQKLRRFRMFTVSAEDKFGKFGVIGVFILEISKKKIFIDTLLMSCRLIGKEIEKYIINFIIEFRNKNFANLELIGMFVKTKKNYSLVHDFYDKNNFNLIKISNKVKYYSCNNYIAKFPKHISVYKR